MFSVRVAIWPVYGLILGAYSQRALLKNYGASTWLFRGTVVLYW